MPGGVVQGLGGVKDAIVVGLVVHAAINANRLRHKFDLADKFALCLLALIGLYLVAPTVVPGLLGSSDVHVRTLAARQNGLFVLAFLAIRHADISREWTRRIVRTVVVVALIMTIGAVINVAAPDLWKRFLIDTVHLPWYNSLITGEPLSPLGILTQVDVGGQLVVRASSLLSTALVLGFFLLPAFAICLQHLSNRRVLTRYVVVSALCSIAIVATATRSAILAAIVTAAAVVRLSAMRRAPGWMRVLFLLVAAAIVIAPIGGATTAGQRVSEATSGQDESAQGHLRATQDSIQDLAVHPLGRGLGTAPGIGERFNVQGHLTSEDAYLQVGNEIGVLSMIAFIGLLISTIAALGRRARSDDPHGLATAMCAAGVGLAIGGFFLHIWLDFATALTFWSLAGLALAPSVRRLDARDAPQSRMVARRAATLPL
jgi:hypothetical protein